MNARRLSGTMRSEPVHRSTQSDHPRFRSRLAASSRPDRAAGERVCSGDRAILAAMPAPLVEFPADDPERARRFWHGVLGVELEPRPTEAGSGWEIEDDGLRLGVHGRGRGPGDTASLPYFTVADLGATLDRVRQLGGAVIHPGEQWAVCRDSEGSPFGLAAAPEDAR